LYSAFPVYSVVTSLFNHGSLLAYAIITILTIEIKKLDKYILAVGVAFNCLWALILRPFVLHPGVIFIYEILDATLVTRYITEFQLFFIIIYFIVFIGIVYLTMKLMYIANNWYRNKHTKVNVEYKVA
jgi:hypothetical protein